MTLSASSQPRPQLLTADFFTNTHRFSASVAVAGRRLADVLNDRLTDFLEVRNVYISRLDKPGEILGVYKQAALIKKQITFMVIAAEADALSQEYKYNPLTRSMEDIFLSVPSFEISGKLEIVGKFDLKAILAIGTTTFIPLFQGSAIHTSYASVNFGGPVILVNKTAIEFFSVLRHK